MNLKEERAQQWTQIKMANQYTKAAQRKEIIWNLINSGLAGALVFLGSLSSGSITWQGIVAALIATGIVITTKFKAYWGTQENEYVNKIFTFVN